MTNPVQTVLQLIPCFIQMVINPNFNLFC